MKENNSPLYRRRQARGLSIEDAAYINRAGRDIVSETIGREIGGLGVALGEALGKAKKRKQAKTAQEQQAKKLQQITQDAEIFDEDENLSEMQDDIAKYEIPDTTTLDFSSVDPESKKSESGGRLYSYDEAWDLNLEGIRDKYVSKAEYVKDKATKGKETEARRRWAEENLGPNEKYNEAIHGTAYKESVTAFPRKSPLERRASRTGFSNELAGLYSVGQPGPVQGSDDTSQYTEGKTYIAKDRMLSAPSWMGSAAVEGYNMVTEAVNYEKQVQADTQDYFNEQLKGLDPGRTGYNIIDDSITEMVMGQQKKYLQHQKERQQWEEEGRGSEWYIKNKEYMSLADNVLNARDVIKTKVDEFGEGLKNEEIDVLASNPIGMDLLNTISRGGGMIGVADLGEGPSLVGGTRGNEPVNMNLTTIAQQLNKINLVAKQEPMEFYNTFTANLKNGKIPGVEKEIVEGPDGMKTTKYNLDQIGKVADLYIKEELKDVMDAKGYGSALLEMNHGQWEAMVNAGQDPREVIAAQMKANLVDLLRPMAGFESREGTARTTARFKEQVDIRKENRKQGKTDEYNTVLRDLVKAEENVRFDGGNIVLDSGTGQPTIINNKKTLYTAFPNLKKLEGKGVKEVIVKDNKVTIYPQSKTTTRQNADGTTSTSTSAKEPYVFLLSDGLETVQQNIANVAEEVGYKGSMAAYEKNIIK